MKLFDVFDDFDKFIKNEYKIDALFAPEQQQDTSQSQAQQVNSNSNDNGSQVSFSHSDTPQTAPAVRQIDPRELRKQRMIARKTYDYLYYLGKLYVPYTFYECRLKVENSKWLQGQVLQDEKEKFQMNYDLIDWNQYMCQVHFPGIRKYVLGEKQI